MHTCTQFVSKTFLMNQPFLALRCSLNLFTIVMRIALILLHNLKIFLQYQGFNFVTDKASKEFKDIHLIMPNKASYFTPYTKADIRNGYVIPQESQADPKSEKYELFKKQKWFDAVHPYNVQIVAKLDYVISRVLPEMVHTSLSRYKKLCDLDRDLKQTALMILTLKSSTVISFNAILFLYRFMYSQINVLNAFLYFTRKNFNL